MCFKLGCSGININRTNRISDIYPNTEEEYNNTRNNNNNNRNNSNNSNGLPNYISTMYFDNQIRHLISDEISINVIENYLKLLDADNLENIYKKLHCIILDDDNLPHYKFIRISEICVIICQIYQSYRENNNDYNNE
jgi:hypothetical protein